MGSVLGRFNLDGLTFGKLDISRKMFTSGDACAQPLQSVPKARWIVTAVSVLDGLLTADVVQASSTSFVPRGSVGSPGPNSTGVYRCE